MILISCSASHGPNQPLAPKSSTHTRPAITGETANGRSMSESNNARPLKRCLVTAHAAAMPNKVLSGTAMAAVRSVSFTADQAASSYSEARKTSQPRRSASMNTANSGINRNNVRKPTATVINTARIGADSVVTLRTDMENQRFCQSSRRCRRLMRNSSRKEMMSMAAAMTAAPS